MTRLMYTTLLLVFTISTAVLTVDAELHQNTLTVDATDRENRAYVNLTEGSGAVSIEYVLQDNGTRAFIESEPTSVDAQGKLTTTWASIKLK